MIAVVTDSTVYLTKYEAQALGICVVPISYTVSGRLYNESFSDCNGDFAAVISQNIGYTTTSQTSVFSFINVFKELLLQNNEVLCLVLSSRLSGVYSSAVIAAKEVDKDKIAVVDSLTTGGGLALLAKKAKQLIHEGKSLKETVAALEKERGKIGIAFSVDNMDFLRRSGRIGIVRQSVGTILNIRPILMCEEGAVVSRGQARGRADQAKKLVEKIAPNAKEIILHYLDDVATLEPLLSLAKEKFPNIPIFISRLGPVLGIHLGMGAIGVVWMTD